ncbi:MAG: helix-turn-helix transcriptional regulator [Clostridia bacterium]|nr:helix-turn-helix transcriptional regulator [Clostridia bacterium]
MFRERITSLRLKKNVSAREMSLAIGQCQSYINVLENGKGFPSMDAFFNICDYFEITPKEFFDFDSSDPKRLSGLIEDIKQLSDEQIELLSAFVKQMK